MQKIELDLGKNSYPIIIGSGLLDMPILADYIRGHSVLIVTNDTIAPLYLDKVIQQLAAYRVSQLILPDGEQYKTLATFEKICAHLLHEKHARDTTIIALGGGVIGDISGFAAACYQRGVDFIQIPTSLLAQVDSAVGGKTAINLPLGKNMLGAFYQPKMVLIDTSCLNTLDDRQLSAGIAEIIKYGLIIDYDFFLWLENNISQLLNKQLDAIAYAIEKSCSIKADIVAQDETEHGIRAILNFGHTLGHSIEACQNYTGLLHGEAVAIGMLFAASLSVNVTKTDLVRIENLLAKAGLPTKIPADISPQKLLASMQLDKKVLDNKLRWILLEKLGSAKIFNNIASDAITDKLKQQV